MALSYSQQSTKLPTAFNSVFQDEARVSCLVTSLSH